MPAEKFDDAPASGSSAFAQNSDLYPGMWLKPQQFQGIITSPIEDAVLDSNLLSQAGMFLPSMDISGFNQAVPDKITSTAGRIFHFLGVYDPESSLAAKVEDKVKDKMTPHEKQAFEEEGRQVDKYRHDLLSWGTAASLNRQPEPVAPLIPMHHEVTRRIQEIEKGITDHIRANMTPADRVQLDMQLKTYFNGMEKAYPTSWPGMGSMIPMPVPGNVLKDYYAKVKEETQQYLDKP